MCSSDLIANANSSGTLQGYIDAEESGLEIMKGWLTVGDESVDDEICGPNEEESPIPVSQRFQSGHMAPIGHVKCRCALIAYVNKG